MDVFVSQAHFPRNPRQKAHVKPCSPTDEPGPPKKNTSKNTPFQSSFWSTPPSFGVPSVSFSGNSCQKPSSTPEKAQITCPPSARGRRCSPASRKKKAGDVMLTSPASPCGLNLPDFLCVFVFPLLCGWFQGKPTVSVVPLLVVLVSRETKRNTAAFEGPPYFDTYLNDIQKQKTRGPIMCHLRNPGKPWLPVLNNKGPLKATRNSEFASSQPPFKAWQC